ncbi:hypothetical protein J4229_00955 [Candidatus Pacearchaeota archaeon]|nr:hypothetical protein [Candidatus Pacearchaeota archaeon]
MTQNKELIRFIKEARRRGFDDYEIRVPLIKEGWNSEDVEKAFDSMKRKQPTHYNFKDKVTIYLSNDLYKLLEKRAKKNMLTLPEQIEDILRRSTLSLRKGKLRNEKIDDLLVSLFSRQKRVKK